MITNTSSAPRFAGLGVLLFALCGALLVADHYSDGRKRSVDATACEAEFGRAAVHPDDNNGKLRIVGVSPPRVELGATLCVAVAGVASQARADAPVADLARKSAAKDGRSKFLAAAEAALASKLETAQRLENEQAAATAAQPVAAADRMRAQQARSLAESAARDVAGEEQKLRQAVAEFDAARNAAETGAAPVKLTLFLSGKRADHLSFEAAAKPGIQYLTFELNPEFDGSAKPGKLWREILAGSTQGAGNGQWNDRYRKLTVGLSRLEGDSPEPMTQPSVLMLIYRMTLVGLGGAGAACLIIALVLLARSTTLLRDHSGLSAEGVPDAPYSLGRAQLAMWAVLVFFGFIYIWLTLGQMSGILNQSVLLLLGISATTGLVAAQIPSRATVPAHPLDPAAAEAQAPALADDRPRTSGFFFKDILHDGAGPTLPRIQMLAWSVLLAVIFAWNVLTGFVFADFDTNLLIMMGIVGSSYVAFKPSEIEGPVTAPAAAPAAVPAPAPAAAPGQAAQPVQGEAAG